MGLAHKIYDFETKKKTTEQVVPPTLHRLKCKVKQHSLMLQYSHALSVCNIEADDLERCEHAKKYQALPFISF